MSWQERFDSWFPDGVFIALIEDMPEDEPEVTYICPRIVVLDDDPDHPELMLVAPGVKSVYSKLVKVEERASTPDRVDLLLTTEAGFYRITSHLSDAAREFAHRERVLHPELYWPIRTSELRKTIERYANGIADASEVIAALPKPVISKPKLPRLVDGVFNDISDSLSGTLEGGWNEVAMAYYEHTLSFEQYVELHDLYAKLDVEGRASTGGSMRVPLSSTGESRSEPYPEGMTTKAVDELEHRALDRLRANPDDEEARAAMEQVTKQREALEMGLPPE